MGEKSRKLHRIDSKYNTILSLLPPVRNYMLGDGVKDKRLAKPVVIPIKVDLTYDDITISLPGAGDGIGTSYDVIWSESTIFCTVGR